MNDINPGDIVIFREGHKNEWQPWRVESETQTGSFNIRMPNWTVCGAYPEDIYKHEQEEETQPYHNPKPMHEPQEILKSTGFKITIAIIIVIVTFLYFRWPNTSLSLEQSPIDQKIQEISKKELSKGNEYKIQKDARDKQREFKKIEQESVARVKSTNDEIWKIKKEVMELIK